MRHRTEAVLLLYNQPHSSAASEQGVLDEVEAISRALERLDVPFTKAPLRALTDLPAILASHPAPLLFNLVEALPNDPEEANRVPAVAHAFGRETTGNDSRCLSLALDKAVTKAILAAAGLPVPAGTIVPPGELPLPQALPPGRYIIKPLRSDASEGIDARSVVEWPSEALPAAVRRIHRRMNQPAVIETFFGCRELNVSLAEMDGRLHVFPPAEIDFSAFGPDRPRILTYAAKWRPRSFEYRHTPRLLPASLSEEERERAMALARDAWRALGCRDYARVDLRMDERGQMVVIEVNPNPDIAPEAGFSRALEAAGFSFEIFVRAMLENAARRLGRSTRIVTPAVRPVAASEAVIRRAEQRDREAVLELVRRTAVFQPHELEIAREVLDDALRDGPGGHYQSWVLDAGGVVAGWVCFGPTPCTAGTFDIYWIAVDPACQGRGYGRRLLDHAEREIAARGGTLCVLETSGRPAYRATRGFYERCGYRLEAEIADYYAPNDPLNIYVKRLPAPRSTPESA